jgi:hypothetical protein
VQQDGWNALGSGHTAGSSIFSDVWSRIIDLPDVPPLDPPIVIALTNPPPATVAVSYGPFSITTDAPIDPSSPPTTWRKIWITPPHSWGRNQTDHFAHVVLRTQTDGPHDITPQFLAVFGRELVPGLRIEAFIDNVLASTGQFSNRVTCNVTGLVPPSAGTCTLHVPIGTFPGTAHFIDAEAANPRLPDGDPVTVAVSVDRGTWTPTAFDVPNNSGPTFIGIWGTNIFEPPGIAQWQSLFTWSDGSTCHSDPQTIIF